MTKLLSEHKVLHDVKCGLVLVLGSIHMFKHLNLHNLMLHRPNVQPHEILFLCLLSSFVVPK